MSAYNGGTYIFKGESMANIYTVRPIHLISKKMIKF